MGLAIDTVLAYATPTAQSTYLDASAASGDSLTVRQFAQGSMARLEYVGLQGGGGTVTGVQVKSPALHDNVQGLEFQTSELPAGFLFPPNRGEDLVRGDTLTVSVESDAAASWTEVDVALGIYYANLDGIAAALKNYSDISGAIDHMKMFPVTPGAVSAHVWDDTSINASSAAAQLHADRYYAVLGYIANDSYTAVGIKGQMTGNLRVCGPGVTSTLDLSNYFVEMSQKHGTPHIPVFYANNKNAVYLSVAASAAVASPNPVTLVCAEMAETYRP